MVGLLTGAFRSFCLIRVHLVLLFCCSACFFWLLETPDGEHPSSPPSCSFPSCPLLLLLLRRSVFCIGVRLFACSFSCWRCCVLCACIVVGVRGGFSFLSVFCLLNVCVQECRCCSSLLASSFLRPLVGCWSSCPSVYQVTSALVPVLVCMLMHVHTRTCEPWALAVLFLECSGSRPWLVWFFVPSLFCRSNHHG